MKHFTFFQAVLLTLIIGLNSYSHGYKPEIYIFVGKGAALYFSQAQPDLTQYKSLFDKYTFKNICVRGLWSGFYDANYTNFFRPFPGLSGTGNYLNCGNYYTADYLGSLRPLGPMDTSIEAITLYSGEFGSGEEIIVTGETFTGITTQIVSMVITGKSDWTLYEGQNLNGDSTCFSRPQNNEYFNFFGGIPLEKIGSVRKGCADEHPPPPRPKPSAQEKVATNVL